MNMQRSLVLSFAVHVGTALLFAALVRTAFQPQPQFWVSMTAEPRAGFGMTMPVPGTPSQEQEAINDDSSQAVAAPEAVSQEVRPEQPLNLPQPDGEQGMPGLTAEQYRQYMMLHAHAYAERAAGPVQGFLDRELGQTFRMDLQDAAALIRLRYSSEGVLEDVVVTTESDALVSLLQQFDWSAVPPPSRFLFKTGGIALKVVVSGGRPLVYVLI